MYQHVTDLIGSTPLVALDAFTKLYQLNGRLLGKLEYFNPLGSVKDRVAYGMIKEGIDSGVIRCSLNLLVVIRGLVLPL